MKNLTNKIATYGKKVYADAQALEDLRAEINQQLQSGRIGQETAREKYADAEKKAKDYKLSEGLRLQDELNSLYSGLQDKIVDDPITMDTLAELTLLGQVPVTTELLQEYQGKYRNSPLALMRIKAIGKEQGINLFDPPERLSKADKFRERALSSIRDFQDNNRLDIMKSVAGRVDERMGEILDLYANPEKEYE